MTRLAIDDAVMHCAIAAAAEMRSDHPDEVIGAAWLAANRIATERRVPRLVNPAGVIMRELVEAARAGAATEDGPRDEWPHLPPATPYEETDRVLRTRWLEDELAKLSLRDRSILRMALGLDDAPDTLTRIGEMHDMTGGMAAIVIDRCVSAMARSWASSQFEAAMRLDAGHRPAVPDMPGGDDAQPRGTPPRRRQPQTDTPKWTMHRRRGPHRPKSVRLAGSTLVVGDHRVQRMGGDRYRMAGIDVLLDAAGVARTLRSDQPDDGEYRRLRVAVEAHDTFIADEMRSILRRTVMWPTKATERRALPLFVTGDSE